MIKKLFSKNWKFSGPGTNGWTDVDIPHDYSITQDRRPEYGGSNGFYPGGRGRYVKYFKPDEKSGHVFLDIDGAYMCAEISVNDQLMAIHPHGYAPFVLDITDKLRFGKTNKISIVTDAHQPSTRWYSGAGIYRDVFLWTGGSVRVEPRDVFITTPKVSDKKATVKASYQISADADRGVSVIAHICKDGREILSGQTTVQAKAGEKTPAAIELTVSDPKLWDTDHPQLYTLYTEILSDGIVTDECETTFGIRRVEIDAEEGLRLNGKEIKLQGGCIHHDHGVLGAAAWPAAEERKLTKLKSAGFNAIRTSHYPPSSALLEVCDRIGLLVMDEAFDMWIEGKNSYDYHLWFADWWQRDIAAMVLRDRNHPSVISFSIGNEVDERAGKNDGAVWSEKLASEIRRYDDTRPVTMAICGLWEQPDSIDPEDYRQDWTEGCAENKNGKLDWASRTEPVVKPLDIVGYNYLWRRYEADSERYPDRVIWGSETVALDFWDSWNGVMTHKNVIGDFTWTAYDNLGEAGTGRGIWERDGHIYGISVAQYPWRSCYQGDFDLAGYRRPQSYFRERIWKRGLKPKIFTTHPEHFGETWSGTNWHWYDVLDSWTFDDKYENNPVKCDCYTDADYVIWKLNGKIVGRSEQVKGIASMDIPYRKGTLEADAYKQGVLIGSDRLITVGAPAKLKAAAEKNVVTADNRDLLYVDITVTDIAGNRVPDAKTALKCTVAGGELMGIFSGDPCNEDKYGSSECHAFTGRAAAVIRTDRIGEITVLVSGEGVSSAAVKVKSE